MPAVAVVAGVVLVVLVVLVVPGLVRVEAEVVVEVWLRRRGVWQHRLGRP